MCPIPSKGLLKNTAKMRSSPANNFKVWHKLFGKVFFNKGCQECFENMEFIYTSPYNINRYIRNIYYINIYLKIMQDDIVLIYLFKY